MQFVWMTFAGVLAIVVGAYWLVVAAPEGRDQSALRRRLKSEDSSRRSVDLQLLKTETVLSGIKPLDALLRALGTMSSPLKETIDQSGLPLTVGGFLLLSTSSFFGGIVLVNWYLEVWWLALPAGALAAVLPL